MTASKSAAPHAPISAKPPARAVGIDSARAAFGRMPRPSNCLIYSRKRSCQSLRCPTAAKRSSIQPVTVADVAASIGAGLAKAALAGRVNDKLVDTSFVDQRRRQALHRHGEGSGGARGHPPFDRASARHGRAGYLPEGAGHHRPGHRRRLLLRFRVRAPVHARGSREDRSQDEGNRRGRPQGHAARHGARRRRRAVPEHGREVQGRDHRQHSVERADRPVWPGRMVRPVPRPARAVAPASSRRSSS